MRKCYVSPWTSFKRCFLSSFIKKIQLHKTSDKCRYFFKNLYYCACNMPIYHNWITYFFFLVVHVSLIYLLIFYSETQECIGSCSFLSFILFTWSQKIYNLPKVSSIFLQTWLTRILLLERFIETIIILWSRWWTLIWRRLNKIFSLSDDFVCLLRWRHYDCLEKERKKSSRYFTIEHPRVFELFFYACKKEKGKVTFIFATLFYRHLRENIYWANGFFI